ncbi:DUF721 domain-containing protein [uncultured Sphingomonas sp.]|uniref:DUF721 domain-containing protein n=1 Tax=uncultured Sphingomonas sp. TaxID=158754 RepID=UPI0035C961D6
MSKRPPARPPAAAPERHGRACSVAELLPAVGGAAFKRYGFVQSGVVTRWSEIVGSRYAAVSTPESIRFPPGRKADGVLTVTVRGAHAPMMQHIAPEIIDRVNRFFGYAAVTRLAFRQGRVAARPSRLAPPGLRPTEPPAAIGEGLRAIADPELRAVLAALAATVAASSGAPIVGGETDTLVIAGRIS